MEISTREDPEVEHENGAFGKSSGGAVDNSGDEVQLFEFVR